ncbi:hypothetical protein GF323_02845 [Candidatus Woesearchaeota archaeon]|nr:hypothetical protein [Candidatus Woesearchaeota archaeon]
MALSPGMMERYAAYKDCVLAHYSELLERPDLKSAGVLIEALREMESRHSRDMQKSNSMVCPANVDFSAHLELTPIDELKKVSELFGRIISFKEKALDEHFSNMAAKEKEQITEIEKGIHEQLKSINSRYHI